MTDLSRWMPPPAPGGAVLEGRLVLLEPLDAAQHGAGLFQAVGGAANADLWTWMPVGPFDRADDLLDFHDRMHRNEGWRTLAIISRSGGDVLGSATYMRIREAHGSCEIGCVSFGPRLRRTPEATEALRLMAAHVFDLGYRRYEWKCNQRNEASKRAAVRFGFTHEGVFRNDMVTKGQSRDTAWYSILDNEWPKLNGRLEAWLDPSNFEADGSQRRTLESFRA